MWIYKKTPTSYQVGYLVLGFWFKVVEEFETVTVGNRTAKEDAERMVSYLNGGELG